MTSIKLFDMCVKCSKEAEYDSPALYCKYHWYEWWNTDENTGVVDQEQLKKDLEERHD